MKRHNGSRAASLSLSLLTPLLLLLIVLAGGRAAAQAVNGSSPGSAPAAFMAPGSPHPAAHAPVANADAYTTTFNAPLSAPAPGVLGNDTDPDGDPLRAALFRAPAGGSLTLNGDGSFVYAPGLSFSGVTTFTYWAGDAETPPVLAYWPLDDGADPTADVTGNGHPGHLMGGAAFTTTIPPGLGHGQALDLDGVDDYVLVDGEPDFDLNQLSVLFWVKVDAFDTDWQAMVTKGDDSWRVHRAPDTNNLSFGTTGLTNLDLEGTRDINDGQWHHVAAIYDGSTKYLYVDGALDASVEATGTINNDDYAVAIGENLQALGRNFDGQMDDVRIYPVALTLAQVRAAMGGAAALAYWPFDDGANPTADVTGHGHVGQLNGDAVFTTTVPAPLASGQAIDLDGDGDYVLVGDEAAFDLNQLSVLFWVKVDTFDADWQAMVTKGDGAWRVHRYQATNHVAFGTTGLTNLDLEGTRDINDGQWHHVAAIYEGSTKYLYVDGALDASVGATGTINNSDYPVAIGANLQFPDRAFDGQIDDVRIYPLALSAAEVHAAMENTAFWSDPATVTLTVPAGPLLVTPNDLETVVTIGQTRTLTLTVENVGPEPAAWRLSEVNLGSTPLLENIHKYPYREVAYWDPSEGAPAGAAVLAPLGLGEGTPVDVAALAPLTWGSAAPLPSARYRSAGVSCDGSTYYVMGGWAPGDVALNENLKYDPDADTWTAMAPMPVALATMQAACIGGYIYLVGGYTGSAHTNDFLVYDTAANSWTRSTWPYARTPMVAAYAGKLYAFGGLDSSGTSSETWEYDPTTGLWSQKADMPVAARYGDAVTAGDYIYVIGGTYSADVQRYDPTTDTWDNSGPDLPGARMSPLAAWYGDRIYVMGGGGCPGIWDKCADLWYLDLDVWPGGSWAAGTAMPAGAVAPAGACVAGRLYAAGGARDYMVLADHLWLDEGLDCYTEDVPWLDEIPVSGTLAAQSTQVVSVTFDAGAVSALGQYRARLIVRQDTPYSRETSIPITMTVILPAGVALGDSQAGGGRPGETVTYRLTLTNTGQVTDTFDLAAGGHAWPVDLPAATEPLAPGASMTFTVTVTIPFGVAGGSTDAALITATSRRDPYVSATAALTTTAGQYEMYAPLVLRNAGGARRGASGPP